MESSKKKYLIIVVGPTAVGKTDLAIELALHFNTSIISADARQFYKEMNMGTAKPSLSQLNQVNHYFINSLSITDIYNVGQYEQDAIKTLNHLFELSFVVVAVGGSGLYIQALCEGMDEMPTISIETRNKIQTLYQEKDLYYLVSLLEKYDPIYYEEVDKQNPQRIMRALEVYIETNLPFSSFRKKKNRSRDFEIIKIGLEMDREQLYNRINQRVDQMVKEGLIEEATSLYSHRKLNALQTVGYKEVFDFLDGKFSKEKAIELIKQNTRRYAKRQLTWFRTDDEIYWFKHTDQQKIIEFIKSKIKNAV